MKNNLSKNIKFMSLILVFGLVFLPKIVLAENGRCTYTNYYFFSEINDKSYYESTSEEYETVDGQKQIYRSHGTLFPALVGENIDIVDQESGKVCLKKNGSSKDCDDTVESMDLATYHQIDINIFKTSQKSTGGIKYWQYTNKGVNYFEHGAWYEVESGVVREYGADTVVDISGVAPSSLVNGSLIASDTEFGKESFSDKINFTIKRKIFDTDYDSNVKPFSVPGNSTWKSAILTPALYKLVYTADCKKYNAEIDYYEKVGDKEVPITKFDGGEPSPWKNSSPLDDGSPINVTSPKYKNCTPNPTKVTGKIEGQDFKAKVVYTCPTDSKTYTAKITYYVRDSKGNKIEVIKANGLSFDKETFNSKYSPYFNDNSGKGLADGYTTTVTTPTIKNCTPDKSSVKVEIKGKNFEDEVVYTCAVSNVSTGNISIYLTWLLGTASLGCVAYFFIKNKKEAKINE